MNRFPTTLSRFSRLATALLIAGAVACGGPDDPVRGSAEDLASLAEPETSTEPGVVSPRREYLFNTAERVVSRMDGVDIAGKLDPGREFLGAQAWVVAMPPGEIGIEIRRIDLLDLETGEERVLESSDALNEVRADPVFRRAFEVDDLGVMRRVRLVAVRIDPEIAVGFGGSRWSVRGFDARLSVPEWQRQLVADSAYTSANSPLRRMIEKAVANPEMLSEFAQASPDAYVEAGIAEAADWQPEPSLTSDFPWLKIPITESGLYTIDGRWLSEAGLDAREIDPDRLFLVSRGREIPMLRTGLARANFSTGARLLFHATDSDSSETRERAYFLGMKPEEERGLRIDDAAFADDGAPTELTRYRRVYRVEEDNHLRTRLGSFLSIREMNWIWEELRPNTPTDFEFRVENLPRPVPEIDARLQLYFTGPRPAGSSSLTITINGEEIVRGRAFPAEGEAFSFTIPEGVLRADMNTMRLNYLVMGSQARGAASVALDAIEFDYDSLISASDGRHVADFSLQFGDDDSLDAEVAAVAFRANRVLALDISDADAPLRLPVRVDAGVAMVRAQLGAASRLLLQEDDLVDRAPEPRAVPWRDLRSPGNSADIVIVSHAKFIEQAEEVAEEMRVNRNTEVMVVDVESIYDAFNYGELSVSAIRLFSAHAMREWEGRNPHTILLVGDANSDGRNIARNNVRNFMPTFTVPSEWGRMPDDYASDQFHAWLAGNDQLADMIVARLSVASVEDAEEVVAKIRDYRYSAPGEWSGRMLTVTDPGEFHTAARRLRDLTLGPWVDDRTINTSDFPWEDNFYLPRDLVEGDEIKVSPAVTSRILESFNDGQGIITFYGHGSPNIWSNQRIWFGGNSPNSDNLLLENRDKLPFLVAFTCNNAAIDYPLEPWNICITEDMMRVPNGGIIGGFLPTGPGFTRRHQRLAEGFHDAIGRMNAREFGMVSEMTRLKYQGVSGHDDHSRMYLLLGDPTLELMLPRRDLRLNVSPGILNPGAGPHRINVQVEADEPLAAGRVVIKAANGAPVVESSLESTAGKLFLDLETDLPVYEEEFRLVATATGANGEVFQSGMVLNQLPADYVITGFNAGSLSADGGSRTLTWYVSNAGPIEVPAKLTLRVANEDAPFHVESLDFGPGLVRPVSVEFSGEPGVHVIEAEITPARLRSQRVDLPTTRTVNAVTIGPFEGDVELAIARGPGAFRVLPARSRSAQPIAEVFIANLGGEQANALVRWKLTYADGREVEGHRGVGRLDSGSVQRVAVPMTMELEMTADVSVELFGDLHDPGTGDLPSFTHNRLVETLRADLLPDLRLVEDSLRISPGHIAEGVSIFFEGEVENIGDVPSWPVKVGVFSLDDEVFRQPLRSLVGPLDNEIPGLLPGQRWPFRIRWDPVGNRRPPGVTLLIDSDRQLVESNRENNRIHVDLDIKTKWELAPAGIQIRRGRPGYLVLTAFVENRGQTDARNVGVRFYADAEQSSTNLLGEIFLERVGAGQRVEVPFDWNLEGWDPDIERTPSFSIALRGSLQRVSSVTEGSGN